MSSAIPRSCPPLRPARYSAPPAPVSRASESKLSPTFSQLGRSNATTRRSVSNPGRRPSKRRQLPLDTSSEKTYACMADELAALVQAAIDDIAIDRTEGSGEEVLVVAERRSPLLAEARLRRPFGGNHHYEDGEGDDSSLLLADEEQEEQEYYSLHDSPFSAELAPEPLAPTPSTTRSSPVATPGQMKGDDYFRVVVASSSSLSAVDADAAGFADALDEAMHDLLEGFRVKRGPTGAGAVNDW